MKLLVRKVSMVPVTGSLITLRSEGKRVPICDQAGMIHSRARTADRYDFVISMIEFYEVYMLLLTEFFSVDGCGATYRLGIRWLWNL